MALKKDQNNQSKGKNRKNIMIANTNNIKITKDIANFLGIENSPTFLHFSVNGNKLEVFPNIHSLAKVYIEITSECNLNCQSCLRRHWKEKIGNMDLDTFHLLIDQLKDFPNLQSVMFSGIGEPTLHPDILYIIQQVKSLGAKVEIVTNGTQLDETILQGFISYGLDRLWVSFDGVSAESFEDIRSGANFQLVLDNMKRFKAINVKNNKKVEVGIVFVLMKKNREDLKNLSKLAETIGAEMVMISNVIPYSGEIIEQMLCSSVLNNFPHKKGLSIKLPLLDWNEINGVSFINMLKGLNDIYIMNSKIERGQNSCPFIKERSTFIRWDGMVSPCLGLLHSYKTYLAPNSIEREVKSYSLGNIRERKLKEIWYHEEYHNFRERVNEFDFSPCLYCVSCEFALDNTSDCFGSDFPACGGCLWAQGIIQCP